jgi:hypothetical protein
MRANIVAWGGVPNVVTVQDQEAEHRRTSLNGVP